MQRKLSECRGGLHVSMVSCEELTSKLAVRTSPGQKDGLVGIRHKVMGMESVALQPDSYIGENSHSISTTLLHLLAVRLKECALQTQSPAQGALRDFAMQVCTFIDTSSIA